MIQRFNGNEITVHLPVKPYNDLFEKMTANQKFLLKEKLITLHNSLLSASQSDAEAACSHLRTVFGEDFPG